MAIFAAIAVPAGFRERFHFFLQNGYSRKTLFLNFLISFIIVAAGMAVLEIAMVQASDMFQVSYQPMYQSVYTTAFAFQDLKAVGEAFLWHMTSFLAMMGLSFAGFIAFYKASKTVRYIIFLILPMILVIGVPMIDIALFDGVIIENVFTFIIKAVGLYGEPNPYIAMITFSITFIIGVAIAYLMIRKTNIQN